MSVDRDDPEVGVAARVEDPDYEALGEKLGKAVGRICPPWLAASRDDLVQVALMKVMKLERRGEGIEALPASYLWKVAYSAMIDEIRRHRRRREQPLDDEPWKAEPTVAAPSPERRAIGVELGLAIRECLQQLVKPRRMAVTLHLQGHAVPEMAGLLGWEPKRADNLVYRGLKNLRECLKSKGLQP